LKSSDLVGSIGVAILLIAFLLNLVGRLRGADRRYQAMNAFGAALTCWASWQIEFWPFVVLEATWSAAAVVAMVRPTSPEP
jgi:hypothetical protein